ncbi:MAG: hypothetical protein NTY73_01810 [Candidatus Micrarchaeota archaeon]|nr:hypothetical protein [Candidatus Micrarchaeota archaeon]
MKLKALIISVLIICSLIHVALSQNVTENATTQQTAGLIVNMTWLHEEIESALSDWVNSQLLGSVNLALQLINALLLLTPDVPSKLFLVHTEIIKMLVPLYLLVLSWNAIQIMTSEVLSHQASARITIQNSVISMLLVALSLPIYNVLLKTSQSVSSYLVSINFKPTIYNSFAAVEATGFSVSFLLGMILIVATLLILFLLIRLYIIAAGVLLFPIGIFMYFFSPLRKYGKLILSFILFFLFVQVLFSVIVFVMNVLISAPPQSSLTGIDEMSLRLAMYLGGLSVLLIIPLTMAMQVVFFALFPEIKLASFIMSSVSAAGSASPLADSNIEVIQW